MEKSYLNKEFCYTDPAGYDKRKEKPLEAFVKQHWDPILRDHLSMAIEAESVVCDLGCGTMEHTQYMEKARQIFAVDMNGEMLKFGQYKIARFRDRVTVLTESAEQTSIPDSVCDIIWTVGLTEYVDLEKLFAEIGRIGKVRATLIVQFPNKFSPANLAVKLAAHFRKIKIKNYRSLGEIKVAALRQGWRLRSFESTAVFLPAGVFFDKYLIPIWRLVTKAYQPIQRRLPLGVNILCVFEREQDF